MVRELAGYDPDRIAGVMRWPLREALLAYVDRMKADALEGWRHDMQVWAEIAPHSGKKERSPPLPEILRG